jgi:hypothetical protein
MVTCGFLPIWGSFVVRGGSLRWHDPDRFDGFDLSRAFFARHPRPKQEDNGGFSAPLQGRDPTRPTPVIVIRKVCAKTVFRLSRGGGGVQKGSYENSTVYANRAEVSHELNMSFDKILTLVPVLAVALAITFDAGYFWGIDINFFTLFSLSEHLVFAIQAIPNVLEVMVICSIASPLIAWLLSDTKVEVIKLRKRRIWAQAGMLALIVALLAYSIWVGDYIAFAFGAVLSAASLGVILSRRHLLGYRRELLISYVVGSTFFMSFAIGYRDGYEYLRATEFHPHSIHLKDSTAIVGRIVRAGDRGILFVESKGNSLQFIRLEQVISISRD